MVEESGVVIVGGAIAGYNVASRLRKDGYKDKITMLDAKNTLPYDRSELSTGWMLDLKKIEPPLFQKREFFIDKKIKVQLNTKVTELNPEKKIVLTEAGEEIQYDKLVLATGSSLKKLGAKGEETHGVFYLRDHEDALEIKEWSKTSKDLVIIGGGFIGLELAATFSRLGLNVTVVEYDDYPLGKIIGEEASRYFMEMHREHGVKFITDEGGKAFEKDITGKLTKVITTTGRELTAQMAIIGVGVSPNISLSHPDLKIEDGIVVNEFGETSLPDVYAVGDVAVWPYKGKNIHVAHWEHAYNQGQIVARNIMKPKSHPYTVRPYFWTDQYDQTFEYLGHIDPWDKIVTRGSLDNKEFTLAYVDEENIPQAIFFANAGDKRKNLTKFMDSGEVINKEKFKDIKNPL